MHTSYALARAVQRKHKITSAYGLGKFFGVKPETARKWLTKQTSFSDETAIKCARALSLSPAYVVACAQYEKAKTPEAREFWKVIAENAPDISSSAAA